MPNPSPDSPATQAQTAEVFRLLAKVHLRQVQILKLLARHFPPEEVQAVVDDAEEHLGRIPSLQDALSKKLVDRAQQLGNVLESIRWDR